MEQIMKKINSHSAKQNDKQCSNDASLDIKNTQIVSNYDSHSEEKPHQTKTVSTDNTQDRSSGLNIDITNENEDAKIKIIPLKH